MTKNTGYQVIDFKNIDISNDGSTITGVYEKIAKSNGKPLYITNVNYAGKKIGDQFSASYLSEQGYNFALYTGGEHRYFLVNTDDEILAD